MADVLVAVNGTLMRGLLLDDGSPVVGVPGEPFLVGGQPEITDFGGGRSYLAAKTERATS